MFHPPLEMVVYCKNACISTVIRQTQMLAELLNLHWDAICFNETRLGIVDNEMIGGHRLISHRGNEYGGVAILLHAKFANCIVTKRSFGNRILAVRLRMGRWKFCIISIYMPHAGYPVSDLDHIYDNAINAVTWAYQHTRSVVIGGDFNTV